MGWGYSEWGDKHPCIIDNNGTIKLVENKGLINNKVNTLTTGIKLQTLNGPKIISCITEEDCNDKFVYNLIVDGSHTYTVDGYAVISYPREDDFDYTTWKQKKNKNTIENYL